MKKNIVISAPMNEYDKDNNERAFLQNQLDWVRKEIEFMRNELNKVNNKMSKAHPKSFPKDNRRLRA